MMAEAILEVFRGDQESGSTKQYKIPISPGMVVLDALHYIQGHLEPDLAVRWKLQSRQVRLVLGRRSMADRVSPARTRMDSLPTDKPITVFPMKSFPVIKDLVTDVSWNYRVNKKITPFTPRPNVKWKMYQEDVDRVQEVPQVH